MTYWNREHEQNLRRIADILRDIDLAYEATIPSLIFDLREDDLLGTETSVNHLLDARRHFVAAQGSLEKARESLPTPRFPVRFKQLHPTAQDVMEREG